jgi:hypothetical protein
MEMMPAISPAPEPKDFAEFLLSIFSGSSYQMCKEMKGWSDRPAAGGCAAHLHKRWATTATKLPATFNATGNW